MPRPNPRPTPRRLRTTEDPSAPPIPMPSAIYASWFPASILTSTGETLHKVKVYAADTGLYVYATAPDNPRSHDNEPVWYAPVAYGKTPRPPSGTMAANGFPLETERGTVSILPTGGCGCGQHALKSWGPPWAHVIQAWPNQVEQVEEEQGEPAVDA